VPWAEVSLDGRPIGTTPLKPVSLSPGVHTVRLQHPDYRPLQKKVNVRPGEVTALEVDLAEEAFPAPAKER
jgi:serine/threonine-protein kinase